MGGGGGGGGGERNKGLGKVFFFCLGPIVILHIYFSPSHNRKEGGGVWVWVWEGERGGGAGGPRNPTKQNPKNKYIEIFREISEEKNPTRKETCVR